MKLLIGDNEGQGMCVHGMSIFACFLKFFDLSYEIFCVKHICFLVFFKWYFTKFLQFFTWKCVMSFLVNFTEETRLNVFSYETIFWDYWRGVMEMFPNIWQYLQFVGSGGSITYITASSYSCFFIWNNMFFIHLHHRYSVLMG